VQEVYDKSWTQGGYPAQSCWGCRFGADVVTRLPFHSVLDAGTGNGALVRLMRKHGARRLELDPARQKAAFLSQPYRKCFLHTMRRASAVVYRAAGLSRLQMKTHGTLHPLDMVARLTCLLRGAGKSAWGIELSKAVLDKECPDLLKDGYVEAGILTNLPYANSRFDPEHVHTACNEGFEPLHP